MKLSSIKCLLVEIINNKVKLLVRILGLTDGLIHSPEELHLFHVSGKLRANTYRN